MLHLKDIFIGIDKKKSTDKRMSAFFRALSENEVESNGKTGKKKMLKNQIEDLAGNVIYTYSAHWNIVARLKRQYKFLQVIQIVLTALSTCGFLATIIAGISYLSWLGGATSALALAINLYMLNFNIPKAIESHRAAANALWDVRESYRSLLIDFHELTEQEIRQKRDELIHKVSEINKRYPETDDESFKLAQKDINKYGFSDNEAAELMHSKRNDM